MDQIEELLELFPLEELFEHLDITPYQVLKILLDGGHVNIPPYLERDDEYRDREEA